MEVTSILKSISDIYKFNNDFWKEFLDNYFNIRPDKKEENIYFSKVSFLSKFLIESYLENPDRL